MGGSHQGPDVLDPIRGWKVDSRPVGRDAEIAEIRAFLSAASGTPAALAITGDAGIGKTVVWQHVLQAAAPLVEGAVLPAGPGGETARLLGA